MISSGVASSARHCKSQFIGISSSRYISRTKAAWLFPAWLEKLRLQVWGESHAARYAPSKGSNMAGMVFCVRYKTGIGMGVFSYSVSVYVLIIGCASMERLRGVPTICAGVSGRQAVRRRRGMMSIISMRGRLYKSNLYIKSDTPF